MRKPKYGDVKWPIQGHSTNKWLNWNSHTRLRSPCFYDHEILDTRLCSLGLCFVFVQVVGCLSAFSTIRIFYNTCVSHFLHRCVICGMECKHFRCRRLNICLHEIQPPKIQDKQSTQKIRPIILTSLSPQFLFPYSQPGKGAWTRLRFSPSWLDVSCFSSFQFHSFSSAFLLLFPALFKRNN